MAAWPPGNWVKHLINNAGVPTFLLHHFLVSTIKYKNNGRHCLFCELDIAGPNTGNKTSYLTNNNQYIKLRWFLKYVNLFSNLVYTRGVDVDIVCPVECNSCSGQERSPILDLLL